MRLCVCVFQQPATLNRAPKRRKTFRLAHHTTKTTCKQINAARRLCGAHCRREKRHPFLLPFWLLGSRPLRFTATWRGRTVSVFRIMPDPVPPLKPQRSMGRLRLRGCLRVFPVPPACPFRRPRPGRLAARFAAVRPAGRATRELGGDAGLASLTRDARATRPRTSLAAVAPRGFQGADARLAMKQPRSSRQVRATGTNHGFHISHPPKHPDDNTMQACKDTAADLQWLREDAREAQPSCASRALAGTWEKCCALP